MDPEKYKDVVLVITGSCRAKDDEDRLAELQEYVRSLHLENHVVFKKNIEWKLLFEEMKQSMIGLHTMKDEHFGIVVVELIAAGLVTIAHKSAGPKYDIIKEDTLEPKGFLSETEEDFVTHLKYALDNFDHLHQLRENARKHAKTFSDEAFVAEFKKLFDKFIEETYTSKAKTQ